MATFYNKIWEKASHYPDLANWIMPGSSKKTARCRFCGGNDISLANMGVGALKSHTNSKKHKLMTTATQSQPSLQFQGKYTTISSAHFIDG